MVLTHRLVLFGYQRGKKCVTSVFKVQTDARTLLFRPDNLRKVYNIFEEGHYQ